MAFDPHAQSLEIARASLHELSRRQGRLPIILALDLVAARRKAQGPSFTDVVLAGNELIELLILWAGRGLPWRIDHAAPELHRLVQAGRGEALLDALEAALITGACALEERRIRNAWFHLAQAVVDALDDRVGQQGATRRRVSER